MPRTDTAPQAPATPSTCPFCKSTRVTTSKVISDATYWRCHGCGQIWNPARLNLQPVYRRRW